MTALFARGQFILFFIVCFVQKVEIKKISVFGGIFGWFFRSQKNWLQKWLQFVVQSSYLHPTLTRHSLDTRGKIRAENQQKIKLHIYEAIAINSHFCLHFCTYSWHFWKWAKKKNSFSQNCSVWSRWQVKLRFFPALAVKWLQNRAHRLKPDIWKCFVNSSDITLALLTVKG